MPTFALALTVWGASFVLLCLCEYEWDMPEPSDQQENDQSSQRSSSRSGSTEKESVGRNAYLFPTSMLKGLVKGSSHFAPKLDLEALSPPHSLSISQSDLSADDEHLSHLTSGLLEETDLPTSYVPTSSISSSPSSSASSSPTVFHFPKFTRTRPVPIPTALRRTRLISRRRRAG
eukprot:g67583.t1